MPIPLIAYLGAAGLGAYFILRKKPGEGVITVKPPGSPPAPPPPVLPPPPPGQPPPSGFVALPSGAITQAIPFGATGFTAASDPSNLNNPLFSVPGNILVGDCLTIDIGAAGLNVQGISSGNVLFKVTDPMDGTNGVKGTPVDPRLPPNLEAMVLPKAAITGSGTC
jgi:hypothetical protein